MVHLVPIILMCGIVWWFMRRRKQSQHEKTEQMTASKNTTPRYVALTERPEPLSGYDVKGEQLENYIKNLVSTRSNLNCAFDLHVNSYMRGYSLQDKKRIRASMKVIMESCDIIRNSNKGDTIISRFDVIVNHIELLISEFKLKEAKEKIKLANAYKPIIFTGAYFREIQTAIDKISSLKTQKSKQRYFERIEMYINKIMLIGYTPQEELAALERFVKENQVTTPSSPSSQD